MHRLTFAAALAALMSLLPLGAAFGQQPPAPVPVLEKRFEATAPAGPYDEVLLALDLAPGTEFPTHSHGGAVFVSVVDGTLWERSGGQERTFNAGDTFTEEAGRIHSAGNRGPGTTRLLITVLLPKGAQLTTDVQSGAPQDLPPGATVAGQGVLENPQAPAPMDVVQRVTDLPAGAVVAQHTHPGPNFNVLVQGQIVLNMQGAANNFKVGDSWVEPPNVVHGGNNTGTTTARIVGSALVPRGAPVATPAQQPGAAPPAAAPAPAAAPPAAQPTAAPTRPAGAAPAQVPGQLPRTGGSQWPVLPMGLVGFVIVASGALLRRRK
jgi:quercetin dioxygenase-like cupin family protein